MRAATKHHYTNYCLSGVSGLRLRVFSESPSKIQTGTFVYTQILARATRKLLSPKSPSPERTDSVMDS